MIYYDHFQLQNHSGSLNPLLRNFKSHRLTTAQFRLGSIYGISVYTENDDFTSKSGFHAKKKLRD